MNDFTEQRAKALTNALPYVDGPYIPGSFSVGQRDTYHFDIYAQRRPGYVEWYLNVKHPRGMAWPLSDDQRERAFCIRGAPGAIYVRDERWDFKRPSRERTCMEFPSVEAAMAWISATLLLEQPHV